MSIDGDAPDEVPFEDIVAAILKVDPEGIIGQQAKAKAAENDEAPGETPGAS